MRKYRYFGSIALILLTLLLITMDSVFAAGTLKTTQDKDNKNKYYFVGNFSHDIWKRSNGDWTSDGHPNEIKQIPYPYSFDFPGRKIKSVTVKEFNPSENLPVDPIGSGLTGATQVYETSRYGIKWADAKLSVSTAYTTSNGPINGIGSSSANFTVNVNGKLDAISFEDITYTGNVGAGVEGRRYYFPSLITIELEPEGGQVSIKHFTTSGQSLNGVNGFTDKVSDIEVGNKYTFTHTPETADYVYKGYKVSEAAAPSGGNIITGEPPELNPYDGKFPVYHINYYYDLAPGGKVEIRHFTTSGQSLHGVTGFANKESKLEVGINYSFSHTAGTVDYVYNGYKKSTVSVPNAGSIITGDPPGLNPYDGSFPVYYINYYYEGNEPPPPRPDPVPAECTSPTPGQSIVGTYMDPVVTAMIRADVRGSEQFDVLLGIPTSERLYGNVFARNYLYQDEFVQMTGQCTFTIAVTKEYTLNWDPGQASTDAQGNPITIPDPQTDSDSKTYQYRIVRPYSFWTIKNLEVYKINQATLVNYALPNSGIVIQPTGYITPYYSTSKNGNYYPPTPPDEIQAPGQTLSGGNIKPTVPDDQSRLQGDAERAVEKIEVENDYLEFNGQTIMDKQRVKENGPTPGQIPVPQSIGQNVLYSPGNMISSSKVNKKDTPSSGVITYDLMPGNINGGSDQQFAINGINTVTVHTPVVNYSSVTDDQAHNQKTDPNYNRAAFILDRPFTVRIPTSGQHVNYPGYGNRDYAKYFRTKQVWFPFDTYNESKTQFIPKNTWVDIPVNQLDTTFFLPVWVDEGDYQVLFRSIAENAPNDFTVQPDANTNLTHHVATDEVSVEVIGRLYDFHITDIGDYNWESVFRTKKGSSIPTGVSYWVGYNGIDGDPRGNKAPFTLPIRPGSNPIQGYKNVAIKTGYHIKFDLKSKGNMFGKQDGIKITPTFYFVTKDGKTKVPVDLYYNSNTQNFIKVGSADDKVQRYVILNERLRNVPTEEMTDTAIYKYDNYFTSGQIGSITQSQYVSNYINKYTKQKTPVGGFSNLMLPEQVRSLIGPKTNLPPSVNYQRAYASIQRWYGEYSLPAAPYVVRAGTNIAEYGRTNGGLDSKSPIFLKNGYIIVNFDIESIKNGNTNSPHLQYINAPLMNQWQMEGFNRNILDSYGNSFNLLDGDIAFYNADKSSRDDFGSQVPH